MNPPDDNTNRHFKGQHETEVVECFFRRHWVVLVKDFFELFLFIAALTLATLFSKPLYGFFSQDSLIINILAFSLIGFLTYYIHHFFLRMIRYFFEIVIITNYRIVILNKSLYLKDSKDAVDLTKIQDLQKRQDGILRNFLNFGSIEITLSSTSTTKLINHVPNPDYHFRKINTLKREYIKDRLDLNKERKRNHINSPAVQKSNKAVYGFEEVISGLS